MTVPQLQFWHLFLVVPVAFISNICSTLNSLFELILFFFDIDLNILDWGNNNCIGVALGGEVFIWHADSGSVDKLMQTDDEEIVTSVKWIGEGHILAVGLNNGIVEVKSLTLCSCKK